VTQVVQAERFDLSEPIVISYQFRFSGASLEEIHRLKHCVAQGLVGDLEEVIFGE
jgi:hypothetical protein